MSMIKIGFPADRPDIAAAFAEALGKIGITTAFPVTVGDEEPDTNPETPPTPSQGDEEVKPTPDLVVLGEETVETVSPDPRGARIDHLGVAFDAKYCANAKDPFYQSGEQSGQWKKRRGVSDKEYNDWYIDALPDPVCEQSPGPEPDTAAAFTEAVPEPAIPQTCGEFMSWVSERQAGGHFTQADVNAAYPAAGLTGIQELFPPTDDATVAANVAKVYAVLNV